MAVLNPPRVIPGLGRSIVNFLADSRREWDEDSLVEAFNPGVNESEGAADAVRNTLSAFRAIGIVEAGPQGTTRPADSVVADGTPHSRASFRRVMLKHVFDSERDGDPWALAEGDAITSGARDLTRALTWFLAQDALGEPLRWTDTSSNVERIQAAQFATNDHSRWPLVNDTRWNAFSRWAVALGLAVPSVSRTATGLVPLPTIAIADAVRTVPSGRTPIADFLGALARQLPAISDGTLRRGLVAQLGGNDPDPGVQAHAVDSSVAQSLRILASRGVLVFESLADANGVLLSGTDQSRTTHVTVNLGKKR